MTIDGVLVDRSGENPIVCQVDPGIHALEIGLIDGSPLHNGRRFLVQAYVEVLPGQMAEYSYTRIWSGRLTAGKEGVEDARARELVAQLLLVVSPIGIIAMLVILGAVISALQ